MDTNSTRSNCIGAENECWYDIKEFVKSCAEFILNKIHKQGLLLSVSDKQIKFIETL